MFKCVFSFTKSYKYCLLSSSSYRVCSDIICLGLIFINFSSSNLSFLLLFVLYAYRIRIRRLCKYHHILFCVWVVVIRTHVLRLDILRIL